MTESRSPRARLVRGCTAGALALGAGSLLTGCGSAGHAAAGGPLAVALREYRIIPQTSHVAAGRIAIAIMNDGRLTHSLAVLDAQGRRIAVSNPVAPGQTGSLVTSLPAGHYILSSGIQGDRALGLYGTLDIG